MLQNRQRWDQGEWVRIHGMALHQLPACRLRLRLNGTSRCMSGPVWQPQRQLTAPPYCSTPAELAPATTRGSRRGTGILDCSQFVTDAYLHGACLMPHATMKNVGHHAAGSNAELHAFECHMVIWNLDHMRLERSLMGLNLVRSQASLLHHHLTVSVRGLVHGGMASSLVELKHYGRTVGSAQLLAYLPLMADKTLD